MSRPGKRPANTRNHLSYQLRQLLVAADINRSTFHLRLDEGAFNIDLSKLKFVI
jgi:hypothetical protein